MSTTATPGKEAPMGPSTEQMTSTERMENVLEDARREFRRLNDDVVRAARRIQHDLDGVIERAEAGYHLNPSGEIQNRGNEFDTLVARRQDAAMNVRHIAWALNVEPGI